MSKIVQKVIGIPFEADGGSSSAKAHCEVNQTDQNCAVRDIEGGARLFSRQRKDIFEQDCGKIWFCVETFSTAGDVKPDSGSVAINYSKESEDTVRLSAYEAPVYLPGLMY